MLRSSIFILSAAPQGHYRGGYTLNMEGEGEHLRETWPSKHCIRRNRMDGRVMAALRAGPCHPT